MTPVFCKCGGGFVCAQCGSALRKVVAEIERDATWRMLVARFPSPQMQQYFRALASLRSYALECERGPRGGAMIDFGNLIKIECFVPFFDRETGEFDALMPMPLDGSVVHDLERSTRSACETGECRCDCPTGWRLTRPIIRSVLSVSDAYLNEHSQELPGKLPTWELAVSTPLFMRALFDPSFRLPTREVSRAARRAAREARHDMCGNDRRKRRRRQRTVAEINPKTVRARVHKPPRPRDRS
jgi:hypothetical protein